MTKPLSTTELDAIRARADAATPGPWRAQDTKWEPIIVPDDAPHAMVATIPCDGLCHDAADWHFIAHARTDIPALLAEVDRLRDELGRLLAAHNEDAS